MTLATSSQIRLEGACNFRDCGGLAAVQGRRIRSGLVFRSNRLSLLTSGDQDVLEGLGIAAIFDLRTRSERERDPTTWRSSTAVTHVFRAGHKRRLIDMALDYPPTRAGSLELMRDFYREMPVAMGHVFGELLLRVGAGATPCVIHCSAGKDRTGVAVAILHAALGVSRDAIIADYVRSAAIPALVDDMASAIAVAGEREHLHQRYPAEALAAVMDASPDYIEQALDAIDGRFGSIDVFLGWLGLTETMLAGLRTRLLEDAASAVDDQR